MDKTIEFEGLSFTVHSNAKRLPVKAVNAYEKKLITVFVEELLGPEQWEKWVATDPDMEQFEEFAAVLGKAYDFETVGESSGSGPSSQSTAEPSPQTSNTSTDSTSRENVNAP